MVRFGSGKPIMSSSFSHLQRQLVSFVAALVVASVALSAALPIVPVA